MDPLDHKNDADDSKIIPRAISGKNMSKLMDAWAGIKDKLWPWKKGDGSPVITDESLDTKLAYFVDDINVKLGDAQVRAHEDGDIFDDQSAAAGDVFEKGPEDAILGEFKKEWRRLAEIMSKLGAKTKLAEEEIDFLFEKFEAMPVQFEINCGDTYWKKDENPSGYAVLQK